MILHPTTFILGAGASCRFGLPTGAGLRQAICGIGTPGNLGNTMLSSMYSTGGSNFIGFVEAFRDSALDSIDSFLARNQQYEEVGKAAISACILQAESRELLHSANGLAGSSDWYGYLWNRMIEGVVQVEELITNNPVSFITFNYDRSLEAFLHKAIMNTFNLEEDEAYKVWTQIPIHHVYGSVGSFYGWNTEMYGSRVGENISHDNLRITEAMKNIKVMPAVRETAEDHRSRDLYATSTQIIFLGFGFDGVNCERLGVRENGQKDQQIYMTTLGMTQAEISKAEKLVLPSHQMSYELNRKENLPCMDALRSWGCLL